MRVGVIGCGYWGPNLIRNFAKRPECQLTAIADRDRDRLERVARLYPGAKAYRSASELLASGTIDAVAIATPMATHHVIAREALNRGIHALVEKPLTASVREAEELIRLADAKGLTLMVDHTFIYTGAVQKLRQTIDDGELGEIFYYDSVRVNLGLFQQDLNVIWDLAPHDFSIMDYLIDKEPKGVSAVGANPLRQNGYDLESLAYVTVDFGDSTMAHFHVNWLSPVKVRRTLIGGSRKMAIYNSLEPDQQVKIVDKGVEVKADEDRYQTLIQYRTGDMLIPKIDQTEALENVCRHFLKCCANGETPLTDGRAGLRVVGLLEAAQRSIEQHRQVMHPIMAPQSAAEEPRRINGVAG